MKLFVGPEPDKYMIHRLKFAMEHGTTFQRYKRQQPDIPEPQEEKRVNIDELQEKLQVLRQEKRKIFSMIAENMEKMEKKEKKKTEPIEEKKEEKPKMFLQARPIQPQRRPFRPSVQPRFDRPQRGRFMYQRRPGFRPGW